MPVAVAISVAVALFFLGPGDALRERRTVADDVQVVPQRRRVPGVCPSSHSSSLSLSPGPTRVTHTGVPILHSGQEPVKGRWSYSIEGSVPNPSDTAATKSS